MKEFRCPACGAFITEAYNGATPTHETTPIDRVTRMGPPGKDGFREQVTVYLCGGKEYPTREAAMAGKGKA